ncbi:hypothetical protein M301_1626 [Methylotenera versatilis 301]|uniref:Uncharacterized protein n=1 Tax=Methylotenera versatilis (strain 301) TaxID=666681 RepID=D7DIX1_METV0|nr:hypothetical protein M301_1626 [Methylotenera versatilis 301]
MDMVVYNHKLADSSHNLAVYNHILCVQFLIYISINLY